MLALEGLEALRSEDVRLVVLGNIERDGEVGEWEQEVLDLLRAVESAEERSAALATVTSFVAWAIAVKPSFRSAFAELVIGADRAYAARKSSGLSTSIGMFPALWDLADAIIAGLARVS